MAREVAIEKPYLCPECGERPVAARSGPMGSWNLFEGYCNQGHYWAVDLTRRIRVVGFGFRIDMNDGTYKEAKEWPTAVESRGG